MSLLEIKHAYTELSDGVGVSHTGDTLFTPVTGATIAASQFTVGKKYLIVIDSDISFPAGGASAVSKAGLRVLHGSTIFPGSQQDHMLLSSGREGFDYRFFIVWVAIATENINVEFRTNDAALTVTVNHLTMFALELTGRLKENKDWFFAEDASSIAITGFFQTGVSITFTPEENSDWLIFVLWREIGVSRPGFFNFPLRQEWQITSIGDFNVIRPIAERWAQDSPAGTDGQYVFHLHRVYSLTKKANTFKIEFTGTGTFTEYTSIFAINLSKFSAHAFNRSETEFQLATPLTTYASLENSLKITPLGVKKDIWFGANAITNHRFLGGPADHRTRLNNIDEPPGQSITNFEHHTGKNGFDIGGNHAKLGGFFGRMKVKGFDPQEVLYELEASCSADPLTEHQESDLFAVQLTLGNPDPPILGSSDNKNKPQSIDTLHGVTNIGE